MAADGHHRFLKLARCGPSLYRTGFTVFKTSANYYLYHNSVSPVPLASTPPRSTLRQGELKIVWWEKSKEQGFVFWTVLVKFQFLYLSPGAVSSLWCPRGECGGCEGKPQRAVAQDQADISKHLAGPEAHGHCPFYSLREWEVESLWIFTNEGQESQS